MTGPRTDDQAARDRLKEEFETAQRRMAEELGDKLPEVTSEEEADKIAVQWMKDDG
ncbi:hypothetical protein P7L87_24520 [Vibrio parahaemolyticus]|nr:hypothetical protein [Vibrio parahaemolyticus]